MMKTLLQAILFQATWFACVLGGSVYGGLATLLYLFLHDHYFLKKRKEWQLMLLFFTLGVIVDGLFFHFHVFLSAHKETELAVLPPLWLLCLWICVATLFAHSLSFLQGRYWLSAGLGFVGPVLSYLTGSNMSDIELAKPLWITLVSIGAVWSLILPLGVFLCDQWGLYSNEGRIHD
ncbi:DUF2878 domain-containing protein [Marinomonas spartinae]|uniref:DUF2878 domain-containing protein n=1 Tax=Marinomonas spartinae TaxID=1792290 RepID=UPI001F389273|nr:DUF2878 domain-containing protein [Marinomonas spartinae]